MKEKLTGSKEQDFTAGPNLAMHAGFCPRGRAINRIRLRSPIGDKTSLHYAQIWLCGNLVGECLPQALRVVASFALPKSVGLTHFVQRRDYFSARQPRRSFLPREVERQEVTLLLPPFPHKVLRLCGDSNKNYANVPN